MVLRYVERNPFGRNAVKRAEEWKWSSLYARVHVRSRCGNDQRLADRATAELDRESEPSETDQELERSGRSTKRGQPLGDDRGGKCRKA